MILELILANIYPRVVKPIYCQCSQIWAVRGNA